MDTYDACQPWMDECVEIGYSEKGSVSESWSRVKCRFRFEDPVDEWLFFFSRFPRFGGADQPGVKGHTGRRVVAQEPTGDLEGDVGAPAAAPAAAALPLAPYSLNPY